MAKKRGDGEGSMFKLPDGRWRGMISLGFWKGKRIRKAIEASTQAELRDKMREELRKHGQGINIKPERLTVGQFLDRWLEDVVKHECSPKTHRTYGDLARLHLKPDLGNIPLPKLSAPAVKTFLNSKGETLSPRTVKHLRDTLRAGLNVAVKWQLVDRNVAALVEPPKQKAQEMRVFTPDEAKTFLRLCGEHRLGALFTTALLVGLRQAEALGLAWPDIDFEKSTLTVRNQLQRVDKKLQLVELKTDKSRRTIALPRLCLSALVEHRRRQEVERQFAGGSWRESGLVFSTSVGTPTDARNLLRVFYGIIATPDPADPEPDPKKKRRLLPRLRFHDLRHSAATLLLVQGVHPRAVMELLGHSRIATTLDTYSHVLESVKRETAAQMDTLFSPDEGANVATAEPVATVLATVSGSKLLQ